VFYHTSKDFDSYSYGCRGESLAAMRLLGDLAVYSETVNDENGTVIHFASDTADMAVSSATSNHKGAVGTIVVVQNIFGPLPVRQRSMNKVNELTKIRTFLQNTSVLHHSVELVLENSGNRILDLAPQRSVAARVAHLHSPLLLAKMTVL
jgi:DNA mismatch repair ATPase MutL